MAEKKLRLKAGVLPAVQEIRRPDFTTRAADIERAEAERVLNQGENRDEEDAAAVKASLEAQQAGGEAEQLDESAITDEPHWYVAHTYSGYENKVKANIEKTIENRGLQKQIFEVQVPVQEVVETREVERKEKITDEDGNETERTVTKTVRKPVKRKMFPGYVLVNMIMNDDTWYVVRNTRGVTGFVGPGSKPVPLTEAEMRPLGISAEPIYPVDFTVGDTIMVIAGVWKDTIAKIQKIDAGKQMATINVNLFDRETPVEISFAELKKYS